MRAQGLTPRQHETYLLAESGLTHPEIADRMGITENTVRKSIRAIRQLGEIDPDPEPVESLNWRVGQHLILEGDAVATPVQIGVTVKEITGTITKVHWHASRWNFLVSCPDWHETMRGRHELRYVPGKGDYFRWCSVDEMRRL